MVVGDLSLDQLAGALVGKCVEDRRQGAWTALADGKVFFVNAIYSSDPTTVSVLANISSLLTETVRLMRASDSDTIVLDISELRQYAASVSIAMAQQVDA